MEQTFYISQCDISGMRCLLTVDADGRTITDSRPFTGPLPRLYSANRRRVAYTSERLRACPVCGKRKVGGCSCVPDALPCERNVGYRFGCIYCNKLRIIGQFSADSDT